MILYQSVMKKKVRFSPCSLSYGLITLTYRAFCPYFFMEVNSISNKNTEINNEIRDPQVRLIGPEGKQIGIVSNQTAKNQALLAKLDLVKIAPNAKPPVCKIMDYGKYKYEQAKMEKEARKKQKVIQVKEIRLSVNIDDNDLNTKARHAIRFLDSGDRLKVALRYKGRQLGRKELGFEVIEKFSEIIKEHGEIDRKAKFEGRSLIAFYSPVKE